MGSVGPYNNGFLGGDYSGIASAGEAFKGFVSGLQDAQDRQMKRQEFDAKMKAMQTQAERDALTTQVNLRKEGYQSDGAGGLTDAPLTARERAGNSLKAFGEGAKIGHVDEQGNPIDYEMDPNTPKVIAAKNQNNFKQENVDLRKDRMDRGEHEAILKRISGNKVALQRVGQYQGLQNALSMITDVDKLTVPSINEFQQALRTQVTAAQKSGVAERSEDYFHSLGLNSATFQQFLTGDPKELAKDSKLVKHLVNSANIEMGNVKGQYEKALRSAGGGHDSMYSRRPDLLADRDAQIQGMLEQMQNEKKAPQVSPDQAKGLVQPGLLERVGGFLGFGQKAQANGGSPNERPVGTEAKTKTGIPVIYKGNGEWVPK